MWKFRYISGQDRCPGSHSIYQKGRGKLSLTIVDLFPRQEFHSSGSYREWPIFGQTSFGDDEHIYRRLGLLKCHTRKYLSISLCDLRNICSYAESS